MSVLLNLTCKGINYTRIPKSYIFDVLICLLYTIIPLYMTWQLLQKFKLTAYWSHISPYDELSVVGYEVKILNSWFYLKYVIRNVMI